MKKIIISIVGLLSIGVLSYVIYHNHIIPITNTSISTSPTINQESEYPVVENEHISYGPITGNTTITYTGKIIAHIESGYITYFSGIIKIPSDLTGWSNTHLSENNVIFLNSEYGPISDTPINYSGKQMTFVYGSANPKRSFKEHCYNTNESGHADDPADYIEQKIHTIDGMSTYFSYEKFNDPDHPFAESGGLCTIVNGNILMIWIQNYSKEEIYSILNSFHFIN